MRPLRSDAAARRDLILDAANDVFAEHGVNAPLELVVEKAGVGRATLYRNFPDRGALMMALLERSLGRIDAHARRMEECDDALFKLFGHVGAGIADGAPLSDYWRAIDRDHPVIGAARRRIAGIFAGPLQRAIDAGLCRPDLDAADIPLITGMLGASLRGTSPAARRALAQRALELVLAGVRPRGPQPGE